MRLRKKRILAIAVLLCLVLAVAVPYGRAEYLTARHGAEFSQGYLQTGMVDAVDFWKVMAYRADAAQVYYSLPDDGGGILLDFVRDGDGWSLQSWAAVWSSSGSADGWIWPYYR